MSSNHHVWALILGAATVFGGGCGSDSSTSEGDTRSVIPEDVTQAFMDCMRRAGFPQMEEGTLEDDDPLFMDQAFVDANERCQVESGILEFIPGHEDMPDEASQKEQDEQLLALARCLRDAGWQVSDPVPGPDGGLVPQIPQFSDDEQQAAFNEDMGSCLSEVGAPVETGGGGGVHEPEVPDGTGLGAQGGEHEGRQSRTSEGGDVSSGS